MTAEDIGRVIELRISQLRDEGAAETCDISGSLRGFYERHLADGTFISWLALDGGNIIATSGITVVEKPPYFTNPTGRIALLSSMYTVPAYRRKGIAQELLSRVADEARRSGCGTIQITASDMGVLLYDSFGFTKNENFRQLAL